MITSLDSYFVYQAERPRARAEQLAADMRTAELMQGFAYGHGVLARIFARTRHLPKAQGPVSTGCAACASAEVGR
jgi:hypothetical protein